MSRLFTLYPYGRMEIDCTQNYNIKFHKDVTIEDFIHELRTTYSKEYGCVTILDGRYAGSGKGFFYTDGQLINNSLDDEDYKKVILAGTVSGLYSRKDYVFSLKEGE